MSSTKTTLNQAALSPTSICNRCLLDNSVPDIRYDSHGTCSYCRSYEEQSRRLPPPQDRYRAYQDLMEKVRVSRGKRKYDGILGISGGRDSSYLAYLAKSAGLNPLLVHFDNGWNTEIATRNIENVVRCTGFDLHTFVVNWPEFRDLQRAYLRASVIDIEVPTDHLILATLYREAARRGIRYIFSGQNRVTESMLPRGWSYRNKGDATNLRAIHQKFGTVRLREFPFLTFLRKYFYIDCLEIQMVAPLDLVDYEVRQIEATLIKEFSWTSPGDKHHESVYTRFYQNQLLPRKFGIVKKKAHLSNLIWSGQLTREEAQKDLQRDHSKQDAEDYTFVMKKLGLSELELERTMREPPREHSDYAEESDYRAGQALFRALARPFAFCFRKVRRWRQGT